MSSSSLRQLEDNLPTIRAMGWMAFDPVWSQRMHLSHGCELIMVQRGRLNHVTEKEKVLVRANRVLLIPPGVEHRDDFDIEEGLEVFTIFFDWDGVEEYCHEVGTAELAEMELPPAGDAMLMLQQLRNRPIRLDAGETLLRRSQLLALLLALRLEMQKRHEPAADAALTDQRKQQLMEGARNYLARHYHQCVALDDIAEALDISPYYLSHVFSEQAGFSLFAYLTNLRMQKACELLREPRHNVGEVAHAVGYDNANYFAKVFKKHLGCSPSHYARQPGQR